MFERFTDRARRVLVLAQDEARALDHSFLGTEHVLLGLLREGEGVGAKALVELGLDLDDVRTRITDVIGRGEPGSVVAQPPFTPRAKKVLELALREALDLGHNYIGTEHQLLGLLREGTGVASQVLVACGLTPGAVRAQVIELLVGYGSPKAAAGTRAARSTTPAADALATRVRGLAGKGAAVGSHHYLLALLEDPNCLAARILESFGVTREAVASRVEEMGTAGTTDAITEPVEPVIVGLGAGVRLELDDAALAAQVREWQLEGLALDVVLERLRQHLADPPPPAAPD